MKNVCKYLSVLLFCGFSAYIYQSSTEQKIIDNRKDGKLVVKNVELFDKYSRQRIIGELYYQDKFLDTIREVRDDVDYLYLQTLKGKKVPIVFDSLNVSYHHLIITPDDSNRFGY